MAVHAPALIASWSACLQGAVDAAQLSGCVGLSAAMVFFSLKLWNVEFLRFDTRARSLVLTAAAVVLLHGNAIQKHLAWAVIPEDTRVAATTLLSLGLRRVQGALVAAVSRGSEKSRRGCSALLPGECTATWTFVPAGWILASRLCTPRAPPA